MEKKEHFLPRVPFTFIDQLKAKSPSFLKGFHDPKEV